MAHVWQIHNTRMGITWTTDGLVSQVLNTIGGSAYDYQPGRAYGDYNLEQQAAIVEDWYTQSYTPVSTGPGVWQEAVESPLYYYIERNIRVGDPG
jgi:hypothetical protein